MELDLSKRRQMYKETRAACEQFHSKYNPPAVNDEVIAQFLNDTLHIELEPGAKLVFFAGSCSQRFGWDGTSKV